MQERHVTIGDLHTIFLTHFSCGDPKSYRTGRHTPFLKCRLTGICLNLKFLIRAKFYEKIILERITHSLPKTNPMISLKDVQKEKNSIEQIYVDDKVKII
jgi:MoxR-like ATPase